MPTLGRLVLEFGADIAALRKDVSQAKNVVNDAANQMKRALSGVGAVLGAIGVGVSVAGIVNITKSVIDAGDALRDLKFATGQSVETLSFLEYAAEASGSSVQSVSQLFARFSKNLQDIANGEGKQAAAALEAVGLSVKELAGLDLAQQIGKVGSALNKIENPAARAAAGQAILGKAFRQNAALVLEGEEGISKMVDRIIELNGVTTTAQADGFDKFNDAMLDLRTATQTLSRELIGGFAPKLADFIAGLATSVPRVRAFFTDAFFGIEFILKDASRAVLRSKLDFASFFNLFGTFDSTIDETKKRIKALTDEIELVKDARKTFAEDSKKPLITREDILTGAAGGIDGTPDADKAKREADKAKREQARLAKELEREVQSVRNFLQDYSRERERLYQDEVRQTRERIKALTEGSLTQRERAVRQLEEIDKLIGSDNDVYGRKAVELFNELEVEIENTDAATQRLSQAGEDFGLTFNSALEDALVNFDNLGSVIDGFIEDLKRIAIRTFLTEPLLEAGKALLKNAGGGKGIVSAIASAFGFGGFRANGGPVSAGRSYVVGERGPEWFVPNQSGSIVPGGGGAGVTIINNTGVPFSGKDRGSVGGRRQIELGVLDALSGAVSTGAGTRELGLSPGMVPR